MADIALGPDDNGTEVAAAPGDRLVITLPENATTGYRWVVESVDPPLEVEPGESLAADVSPAGRAGECRIVLRATAAGSGQVRLRLRRSWEPPERAAEQFTVTVRIAGA